jgi:5-methylcytosine-specific restriction endonuclease McrA
MKAALAVLVLTAMTATISAVASPLDETRYCGPPARTAQGDILRRADVRAAFKRAHPCPSTGQTTGACPGWAIDHVIPLACGGCDSVSNMQWLPDAIKSAAGSAPKDRWERQVYCRQP